MMQTAERVSATDFSDNYVYQRSLFAYEEAAKLVHGKVCEIGTGSGYGISLISPRCDKFITIDKFICELDFTNFSNVEFMQMEVPPFNGILDDTFDFVITFQVLEHIEEDREFLKEILRILKPGGKLILTTPNKIQSLTRNPWHVREYTLGELKKEFENVKFKKTTSLGVFGNEKIDAYLEKNKASIRRFTQWDFLNLQYRLPRRWLQIPYDFFNRLNRRKVSDENENITKNISTKDYYLADVSENSLDLFYIGEK